MVVDVCEEVICIVIVVKCEYEVSVSCVQVECDWLIENGNIFYEKVVQEGIKEQQCLVLQNEVVVVVNVELICFVDMVYVEVDWLCGECDIYVDNKFVEFEEFFNGILWFVGCGCYQFCIVVGIYDYVVC